MRFEYLIDHSQGWSGDENYSSDFKLFTSHIKDTGQEFVAWQDRLFVTSRPIPLHTVKLTVVTPFDTTHHALFKFRCFQPRTPYTRKALGYCMNMSLTHDKYLAPNSSPIRAEFNMQGAIPAVEMGSLFYDNLIEQWLNRVYLQVIGEQ